MAHSTKVQALEDFLKGATDAQQFVADREWIDALASDEAKEIDALLKGANSLPGFKYEQVDGGFRMTKVNRLYHDGEADARVQEVPATSPFRPRYRKLSDGELAHHDAIKTQAQILLDLMNDTVKVRSDAGQHTEGEGLANLKLAMRHLEDAVYRAVKALTA